MSSKRWKPLLFRVARGGAALVLLAVGVDAVPASADPLTLDEALRLSESRSPVLRARRAEVDAASARLLTARTYPFHPELELEAGRRRGAGAESTDRGLRLTQEIEIGGQRSGRRDVAEVDLAAAELRFLRERRLLAARVELAFSQAVRARELEAIAEHDAALTRDFLDLASKRLASGAGTQLEVNLASAVRGRAERRFALVRAMSVEARALLAEVMGLAPGSLPEPRGALPLPEADDELPPLGELVRQGAAQRADLEAFRRQRDAAAGRVRLARTERIPNLRLGAFYEREEGTDEIVGASLGLDLPFAGRNRGAVAEAAAARARIDHELSAFKLSIESEIISAHATLSAARIAAELLGERVLGSMEENLALLGRAFEAGKISATDVLLFRRELIESRRDYVETLADAWQARIALDLAAGRTKE